MVFIKEVIRVLFIAGSTFSVANAQEFSDSYESNTAEQKQTELWSILEREKGTSSDYPSALELIQFLCDDFSLTLSHGKDSLPYKHKKGIHSVGGVARATWQSVGNHSYTGLFEGETRAMVRLSLAINSGFVPGIAIKLFRDGLTTANFVAMNSVESSDYPNYFGKNFSNHIPKPESFLTLFLGKQFGRVTKNTERVGLSDISTFKQDGEKIDDPQFPFQLRLQPNSNLTERFDSFIASDDSDMNLMDQLETIESGTKLYDVYALESPDDTKEIKIAQLFSDSEMITSRAGDEFLFFQHQKIEDDFHLRPDFDELQDREISKCPFRDNLVFAFADAFDFALCPGIRFFSGRE